MSKPVWIQLSKSSGSGSSNISISASENTGRLSRSGNLTIVGNGIPLPTICPITQAGSESTDIAEEQTFIGNSGGQAVIKGYSNSESLYFYITENAHDENGNIVDPITDIPYEDAEVPDLFTANSLEVYNGSPIPDDPGSTYKYTFYLSINIPQNPSTNKIIRGYHVDGNESGSDFYVVQQHAQASLSATDVDLDFSGGMAFLNVSSNVRWEFKGATDLEPVTYLWLDGTYEQVHIDSEFIMAGNQELLVTSQPNETGSSRSITITLSAVDYPGLTINLNINQSSL